VGLLAALVFILAPASVVQGQVQDPEIGQPGKDVVWVPTPEDLVETMLDLAKVTPADVVIDLGSGDGRNVVAAAMRGARAIGIEYDQNLVEVSRRWARTMKVETKATFVQTDMFAADFSEATVLALFLLPSNLAQLQRKFLDLKPGTRIVANTFAIGGWTPDEVAKTDDCSNWCTALLWIVPAKVTGTWTSARGELTLTQEYQMVSGTLKTDRGTIAIRNGRLRGDQISFTADRDQFIGRVNGNAIDGTIVPADLRAVPWTATREK